MSPTLSPPFIFSDISFELHNMHSTAQCFDIGTGTGTGTYLNWTELILDGTWHYGDGDGDDDGDVLTGYIADTFLFFFYYFHSSSMNRSPDRFMFFFLSPNFSH